MSMKTWEKKVLAKPGAAGTRRRIEDELRLAAGLTLLREQAGLSQRDLAKRLGVSQPRIAKIECSKNVTVELLEQYVEALGGHLQVTVVKGNKRTTLISPTPPRDGKEVSEAPRKEGPGEEGAATNADETSTSTRIAGLRQLHGACSTSPRGVDVAADSRSHESDDVILAQCLELADAHQRVGDDEAEQMRVGSCDCIFRHVESGRESWDDDGLDVGPQECGTGGVTEPAACQRPQRRTGFAIAPRRDEVTGEYLGSLVRGASASRRAKTSKWSTGPPNAALYKSSLVPKW